MYNKTWHVQIRFGKNQMWNQNDGQKVDGVIVGTVTAWMGTKFELDVLYKVIAILIFFHYLLGTWFFTASLKKIKGNFLRNVNQICSLEYRLPSCVLFLKKIFLDSSNR